LTQEGRNRSRILRQSRALGEIELILRSDPPSIFLAAPACAMRNALHSTGAVRNPPDPWTGPHSHCQTFPPERGISYERQEVPSRDGGNSIDAGSLHPK